MYAMRSVWWPVAMIAVMALLLAGSPAGAQEETKDPEEQGAVGRAFPANPEDDGAINLAGSLGGGFGDAKRIRAAIGDGPHGSAGTGTGDYDWYTTNVLAGGRLVVDIDTRVSESGGGPDLFVHLFTWDGVVGNPPVQVAADDDSGRRVDPYLVYTNTTGGSQSLYIRVRAFGSIQGDPFDSGSGSGVSTEGPYDLVVGRFGSNASEFPQFLMDSGSLWLTSNHADLVITNTNAATAPRTVLTLENQGAPLMFYRDTSTTRPGWQESLLPNDTFTISRLNTGGPELVVHPTGRVQAGPGPAVVFDLFSNGNLTISGTLTQNSDAAAKADLAPVDGGAVLAAVADLELHEWSYRHSPGVRHLGPTAQDFSAAFGLGASDTGIAAVDADGVALAAIQALVEEGAAKDARIAQLEATVAELAERVVALEG